MLKEIKSALDRIFRNDVNWNFSWLKGEKERVETKLNNEIKILHARIDAISGQGTSNQEILDARVDKDGTIYATLGARLNSKYPYGYDEVLDCDVRLVFRNGATSTQRKINNVWTDI